MLLQRGFERGFERCAPLYVGLLAALLRQPRWFSCRRFCWSAARPFCCYPWLGQDFFPTIDTGQFKLHLRARPARASRRPRASATWWSSPSAARFRRQELESILDNIGLPYSSINTIYSNSGPIGPADADILVSLSRRPPPHRGVRARSAQRRCRSEFPGMTFYFLPADIVSQILNFGLPAPIDVQIDGRQRGGQPRRWPTAC